MSRHRAVLFDLDGTLYAAKPLRRAMLLELARTPLRGPRQAVRTVRRLQAFRSVREELRDLGDTSSSLDDEQYAAPAARLRDDPAAVREVVAEWIHRRPLRHLPAAAWPTLRPTLEALRERGLALGVFSDYPPDEKLAALGVDDLFDVTLAATDPEINAFKPHPCGFLAGASRLGLDPSEVVYVGDRVEVDALGALAAGLGCVILGQSGGPAPDGCRFAPTFADLPSTIAG
ncbi:MAG: HAD-IA family hydrolase [Planctomycetota bacterium]